MDSLVEKVMNLSLDEMEEYEKNLMVGGGTPGPCLTSGKGVRVMDDKGNEYIDCTSQSWALYLGHCNEEIRQTVYDHMKLLTHIHQGFNTKQRYSLAGKLASISPGNLNRVSFTVGGGPAIEAAMKIAIKNNKNSKNFVSLWDAYHGSTLTSSGASWTMTKAAGKYVGASSFLPDVNNNFIRVPNPYCFRCYFGQKPETCNLMCAEMLRLTMQKGVNGPVAGVIVEPIQASAGQIPCPGKYLKKIREICDEYETILIFDEIQTYCRIGEFFAAYYYDVEPDIIVLGKALGAGFPIAAIIIHDKLKGFEMNAEELHTFANNSVSQIAALKQIEIIERDNILENTRRIGKYISDNLHIMQADFPEIGDIRQIGLHIGVELIENPDSKEPLNDEKAKMFRSVAMEKGVILGTGGFRKHVIKIKPPLITTINEADEIINIFKDSLKAVFRK